MGSVSFSFLNTRLFCDGSPESVPRGKCIRRLRRNYKGVKVEECDSRLPPPSPRRYWHGRPSFYFFKQTLVPRIDLFNGPFGLFTMNCELRVSNQPPAKCCVKEYYYKFHFGYRFRGNFWLANCLRLFLDGTFT